MVRKGIPKEGGEEEEEVAEEDGDVGDEDEKRLLLVLVLHRLLDCGLKMVKARWGGRNDGGMNKGAAEEEEEAKRLSCATRTSRCRKA